MSDVEARYNAACAAFNEAFQRLVDATRSRATAQSEKDEAIAKMADYLEAATAQINEVVPPAAG